MPIDINKMFADIIPDTKQADLNEGALLSQNIATPGSALALFAPQFARSARLAAGGIASGITGKDIDTRSIAEKIPEAVKGLNTNDPTSILAAAQRLDAIGASEQAAQLRSMAMQSVAEQRRAQQTADAQTSNAQSNVVSSAAQLLNAQTNASKPATATARYKAAGDKIFDTQTGQWVTPEGDITTPQVEISTLDPDLYDSKSFARFRRASRAATTEDAREKAWAELLPKPDTGWKWSEVPEEFVVAGGPKYEQMPAGTQEITVRKEIDAAIAAGETQRERSTHVVDVMDTMLESLESGETSTGMKGIALSFFPGTNNFAFEGDLDTIRANLGFDALNEARANSATGASGFGQLTEREMTLLQQLENDLKIGLDKETLVKRLKHVKSTFESARDRAKTDWTTRQWIGLEAPPAQPQAGITTPSGNTFTITPR